MSEDSTSDTTRGIRASRTFKRAMNSELPPSRMSVPRPAMLVAMVTMPLRPACATISASRSTFSGLAFSTWHVMSSSRSISAGDVAGQGSRAWHTRM